MTAILPEMRPQTAEDWVIRQREPFLTITLRSARGEVTITRRDDYVGYKLLDGVEGLGSHLSGMNRRPAPHTGLSNATSASTRRKCICLWLWWPPLRVTSVSWPRS